MILLHAIVVLARSRLWIARNTFWRGRLGRKIGLVLLAVLLLAGAWGTYELSRVIVQFVTSPGFTRALSRAAASTPGVPADIASVVVALPSTVLFGATVLLLFSSFSGILAALYLSGDIEMLLVAPVPMRAVFVVKSLGVLVPQYAVLLLLLGPALVGYGLALGYGVVYSCVALLIVLLLPLLPAGFGALIVMAVVRVLPARRARDLVGVLSGVLGLSWFILNQFAPEIAPRIADVRHVNTLLQLNLPLLPSAWAGRALVAAGEGQWLTLLAYGGLFALISLLVFGLCLVLAERLYYLGWSNLAGQGGRVRARRELRNERAARQEPTWVALHLPPSLIPSASILWKDIRLFPRELRNIQRLIFPLVLGGIWTFRLVVGGSGGRDGVSGAYGARGGDISSLFGAGIAFFLCLSLTNVLAGPGISREGRSFWLLKVAPVNAMQIVLGKLTLAYAPFPTVGAFFVVLLAILQRTPVLALGRDLALLLLLGFGCAAISMGMGAAFPRLDWDRPTQQTTFRSSFLAPLFYLSYLALTLGAVIGLPLVGRWAAATGRINITPVWFVSIGWTLAIIITTGASWGVLRFGTRRLERIEL